MARTVRVLGGGLAGSAAAIAALQTGADVEICERGSYPRHKVCGEFLSPEAVPVLQRLGVWELIEQAGPAKLNRVRLYFGRKCVVGDLPRTCYGVSRYCLDALMWGKAGEMGARRVQELSEGLPLVRATGRQDSAPKGKRLFGFKAHFEGEITNSIDLHFFRSGYVGVNCVEDGATNVCGLAEESALREAGFKPDVLLSRIETLTDRISFGRRKFDWYFTGPLVFRNGYEETPEPGVYPAGDTLSFVDPFTGSGMTAALVMGEIAGECAAKAIETTIYSSRCRERLGSAYAVSSILRRALSSSWVGSMAGLVPTKWLFHLTRPKGF